MDKLNIEYDISIPDIDETPLPNENALSLVKRLALTKAQHVGQSRPDSLVLGCDQVAEHKNTILGKPLTHENAVKQLRTQSGQKIIYYSGICLLNTQTGEHNMTVDETHVKFRKLSDEDIERYIALDQPLHCAASFKCEARGMLIVDWVHNNDVHGLIGLSIVSLVKLFKHEGVDLLQIAQKPTNIINATLGC